MSIGRIADGGFSYHLKGWEIGKPFLVHTTRIKIVGLFKSAKGHDKIESLRDRASLKPHLEGLAKVKVQAGCTTFTHGVLKP